MQKHELQKQQNRALLQEEKTKRAGTILEKTTLLNQKKTLLFKLKQLRGDKMTTKELARQALLDKDKTNDLLAQEVLTDAMREELKDKTKLNAEIAALEGDIKSDEAEIRDLKLEQFQTDIDMAANAQGLLGTLGSVLGILTPVLTILQLINGATMVLHALKRKEPGLYAQSALAAKKETAEKSKGMFAGIVSSFSELGP